MPKKYTLPRKGVDKHALYQWSVQDAEDTVELSLEHYRQRRGRDPKVLREDFCGTALVASEWVKGHPERRAIGVDLDGETLEWGRQQNLARLGADRERVELKQCDVRTETTPRADVVQAFNFSYFLVYPLAELINYFRCVRQSLVADGLFMLDCYGGWEYQRAQRTRRRIDSPEGSFGFIWEHESFNPIDNSVRCHIHFEFKNGKRWENAFSYVFRMYSIAEVCDALNAAGFDAIEVLWDFEEEDDAECDYRPATHAENCPGWIAYIIAGVKPSNGRPQ